MHDLDDFGDASIERPLWARWLTRIMLIICGLLMILVMLSQPKVASKIGKHTLGLSQYLSEKGIHLGGGGKQRADAAPATPQVNIIPQSSVPVNRAGVVSGD